MELRDSIWKNLNGGYKIPYDASKPLRKLLEADRPDQYQVIFDELWENLHHKGDVGIASYLAIPQLVTICIEKKSLDWNFMGLCVRVENCRLKIQNPELPAEYSDLYFSALTQFEKYLLLHFKNISDQVALRLTLALFATLNGQPDLGKAIEMLDDKALAGLLKQY